MTTTYRQSKIYVGLKLTVDLLFSLMLIGIPFLIAHILEYMTTYMEIGERSVLIKRGILTSQITEISFQKINAITVKKGVIGLLLGYGDLLITTGNEINPIVFHGVQNPEELKRIINNKQ